MSVRVEIGGLHHRSQPITLFGSGCLLSVISFKDVSLRNILCFLFFRPHFFDVPASPKNKHRRPFRAACLSIPIVNSFNQNLTVRSGSPGLLIALGCLPQHSDPKVGAKHFVHREKPEASQPVPVPRSFDCRRLAKHKAACQ